MLRCTKYASTGTGGKVMYRVHLVTPCSGGYGVAHSPDGWVPGTYAVDLRTRIVELLSASDFTIYKKIGK